MTQVAFGLGDFIGMMGEGVVDTAGMDVQVLAQMLHGNAGAFNMPTGVANAPGGIPFQRLVFKLRLGKPEDKVILIALIGILFHTFPYAGSQIFLIMVIEDIVLIQGRGIKIHIAAYEIGFAGVQKLLNHLDIAVDTVGGRLHHIGALDIQLVAIGKESIGIKARDVHNGLIFPLGSLDHFILAGIGIGCQMAHVGDVHNTLDIIAGIAKGLLQHVLHDIGPQVADMGIVVHRRTAGVHLHQVGIIGNEQLFLVGQRIIQIHNGFLHMIFS